MPEVPGQRVDNSGDVAIPCECREQRVMERLMRTSGLSDELKQKKFSNYIKNRRQTKRHIKQPMTMFTSLARYGTTGTTV